ncbi:type II toxin-antitoxin system RelE/ParE family toxin [Gelidibacter salicanalis]|uniref:Type II toxin-antitoxin system RelE/ParE family toxin n=1 Tax=Gelidibacter salicanalis TaxID=291193 RepID=A0A5C7ADZ2_9FLAO|nr:type II toxin-antitoxin system RelE/ParE family toxin [Gelidibacter salicanalis]TXE06477.1 type II toxin-antitoxin system RelE/ParE family toxin [Gelidibacter salicanalis]
MKPKFEVVFLKQAIDFMASLDSKTKKKVYYNIDKAKLENDPKLFKKLSGEIWEFRTKYNGLQYRLLAFWDKTDKSETLVLSTHGIVKKTDKIPKADIEKATKIRAEYFDQKD